MSRHLFGDTTCAEDRRQLGLSTKLIALHLSYAFGIQFAGANSQLVNQRPISYPTSNNKHTSLASDAAGVRHLSHDNDP